MISTTSALVLALALCGAGVQGQNIQVTPTLPPGIFSLLSSGGTSALNTNTGTYSIGGNSTTFYLSTLLLLPLLVAVVVLDFGIFGAFAVKQDQLNPVSRIFYNVREGLNIVRNRQSKKKRDSREQLFTYR